MGDNILIVHGGGPTAVINASLYGAIKEAKKAYSKKENQGIQVNGNHLNHYLKNNKHYH